MPSGKKSKQARRTASTPPPVQSKGSGSRRRQANPRVLAIVAAVVVLAGVGIGLGIALSGGSSSASDLPTVGSVDSGLPGSAEVNTQLKGIPQQSLTLGNAKAPVTMVEYIDLQCPYCQQFETQVMPNLLKRYVRTGKVRIEARPLGFIGPDSVRGRNAMIAASDQNRAFNFAQVLYYNQGTENTGWLNDAMVGQAAASVPGMQVQQLLSDRNSGSTKGRAADADEQATVDKISGTPTLFVGKTGAKGTLVTMTGPTDQQSVVDAIENALPS